jgi:hypothetical protein
MGQLEKLKEAGHCTVRTNEKKKKKKKKGKKKKKKKKKGKKRRRRKKIFSELIFYCLGCHPMGIPMDFEH